MLTSLDALQFDNSLVSELPGDPEADNHCRQVQHACYSQVAPTPVSAPTLVALSHEAAGLLDLEGKALSPQRLADVFSGNALVPGMTTYASCYGGHQFGHWAGQLGDGRAISLGEVLNQAGDRWELQLKGAGVTPYSRSADGRAVMRSSVREFLCSEAMFHLGVPTTRALTLVGTGDMVMRDMFYDGNPGHEPGAVVCRMAPSFLRFGNFEILASRRDHDLLTTLTDYALRTHFPHLGKPSKETYVALLREVCEQTAMMIAHWMRVGFVHGVMNTDNMSILGLTIDYGPYGWLEDYDPHWTPNTTDAQGRRYCFGQQAPVALWNLVRFAEALFPLVGEAAPLEEALGAYRETYDRSYHAMMSDKLGLRPSTEGAPELLEPLLELLGRVETDYTLFFRNLAQVPVDENLSDEARWAPLAEAYYSPDAIPDDVRASTTDWLNRYAQQVREESLNPQERLETMNRENPLYVLRNYLAQLAIDEAEKGNPEKVVALLDVMKRPYEVQAGQDEYAQKRPEWARHRAGCSMLSCSS
jgi:uncharacterized protein YdiU (UPF0061 family)